MSDVYGNIGADHGQAKVDPSLAESLVREGATLLCMGVPPKMTFGIDMMKWTIADKFKGLKMIPPGLHYVTYRICPKHDGDTTPVLGFFHDFSRSEVLVYEWDSVSESLVCMKDKEQMERLQWAVKRFEFDSGLAPYPLETLKTWLKLTKHISSRTIERIKPLGVAVVKLLEENKGMDTSDNKPDETTEATDKAMPTNHTESDHARIMRAYAKQSKQVDLRMQAMKEVFGFTDIPSVSIPEHAAPHVVSKLHMDRTQVLDTMLSAKCFRRSGIELVGEFEMAFVMFLLGESYEGFDHWKALVHLFTSCEDAIVQRPALFEAFTKSLISQLDESPKDVFVDPLSQNNFLKKCVGDYLELYHDLYLEKAESLSESLTLEMRKLKTLLFSKFHWTFDYETVQFDDDEYAPVVVDLEEAFVKLDVGTAIGEEVDLNFLQ